LTDVGGVPLALAFGAGLVAVVNPCGFAILPAFVTHHIAARPLAPNDPRRYTDALAAGLLLTAGFTVAFVLVGTVVSLGTRAVLAVVPWLTIVVALSLIGVGLVAAAGAHVSLSSRLTVKVRSSPSAFAFGIAYGVASLSCTLPVFLVVVGSGVGTRSIAGTLLTFGAYAIGAATVLLTLCLAASGMREVLVRRIRALSPYLGRFGGVLLVVAGVYLAYVWATTLTRRAGGAASIGFVDDIQRHAQRFVLSLGNGVWIGIGVVLIVFVIGSLYVGARRSHSPAPRDQDELVDEHAS
jgi:cytochrome c biogenesis protein CcdA